MTYNLRIRFTSECEEEITIDKESDVKSIDLPIQQFEGLSFMDCSKTISVPENFNLIMRCSKYRIIDYDENDTCVAYSLIENGQMYDKCKHCNHVNVSNCNLL